MWSKKIQEQWHSSEHFFTWAHHSPCTVGEWAKVMCPQVTKQWTFQQLTLEFTTSSETFWGGALGTERNKTRWDGYCQRQEREAISLRMGSFFTVHPDKHLGWSRWHFQIFLERFKKQQHTCICLFLLTWWASYPSREPQTLLGKRAPAVIPNTDI